jgi:magnesium transporter
MRRLATAHGVERAPGDDRIRECLAARAADGFWLDIQDASEDDFRLLRDVFAFHPIGIDEVRRNAIRPRMNEFEDHAFMTLGTAEWVHGEMHLAAFHLFVGTGFLVTLHDEPSAELDALVDRLAQDPEPEPFVAYLAVDALIDSLFPMLDELDRVIDAIQDRAMASPTPAVLAEMHRIKREVVQLHRMLGTQIDALQRLTTHQVELHAEEQSMYFRNVYDHAVRQFEIVDSLRDLMTSAMDVYLSTVSNNLNITMKQLTVIASVFLPLSFLTGFFGMNFDFLTSRIGTGTAFAAAMVVMAASVVAQIVVFRRLRWI